MGDKRKINVFISYSHKDKRIKETFCNQLATLKGEGTIDFWSDVEILPGINVNEKIREQMKKADVLY